MKLLGLSVALLAFGLVGQANAIDLFRSMDFRSPHDDYLNHSMPIVQSSYNHNSWLGDGGGCCGDRPDFNDCCAKPRCGKLFRGFKIPKFHVSCCRKPLRRRCCKSEPCCEPKPVCCKPEPKCCEPQPCCDPCGRKHRLFGWLKSLHHRCCGNDCGEDACCSGGVEEAVEMAPAEEPPLSPPAA